MYITSTRIPISKLRKFVRGGAITINPQDAVDQASKAVRISFAKLKDQRRMLRNFHLGKGFVLKHDHVNDIEDEDEGGSLFTKTLMKIQHGMETAGKPLEKVFGGVNPAHLGWQIGVPIGNALRPMIGKKKLTQEQIDDIYHNGGSVGGKLTAKKVGRQVKHALEKVGKAIMKEGKQIAKRNKGELGALGRNLLSTGLDIASGDAPESAFADALKDTAKQTGHLALRDVGTRHGIYTDANPYSHGQYADDSDVIGGSLGLGGTRLLRNASVNPMTPAERMAHARSFRKKKGGSIRPIGGSIRCM